MGKRLICLGGALFILGLALLIEGRRYVHPRRLLALTSTRAAAAMAASDVTQESTPAAIRKYREVVRPKRLDAWEIIGPGGGGTFYFPAISPHDPNLVLATSDMRQNFISENGGLTWREFNLRWTSRFTFDPKLPNRIYSLAAAAGLWRSDDRGHTWQLVYPEPALEPTISYMDDEGEIQVRGSRGWVEAMTGFAVDPDDSNKLYGIMANSLMESSDAGRHWRPLAPKVAGTGLYVDAGSPREKRRLFTVSGAAIGVWDGTEYKGDLKIEQSGWFYGSAFGSTRNGPPVLYIANDYVPKGNAFGGGLLATHDGLAWHSVNDGLLALMAPGTSPEFSALGASLDHPEVLYASVYRVRLPNDPKHTYQGVAKTADGGKTWTLVRREDNEVAGNVRESWLSYRFSPSWPDQPLGIGVSPNQPDIVYTTDLGRIMKSLDGGKTWEALYSQGTDRGYTTTGLDVTTCYGIHFDPFDPKRMFITYTDIGLFRSEDGGKSWISSTTKGVPRSWVNTTYWVAFDPEVKNLMWAAMSGTHDLPRFRMIARPGASAKFTGGIAISEDGGQSWRVSNRGMPEMAATHVLLDPGSPVKARVLYATGFGRGVFKSTDGGASWTAKNNGLPAGEPLTWRMARAGDGTLYTVTVRRSQDSAYGNDHDGWVFRSRDGAETWERVPLPEGLNGPTSVTVDPKDPARLYVSAWGRYKLYVAGLQMGGVFLSTDAGRHWTNVLDASQRIYDVTVDPRDPNVVYAAGFESAAWRSNDRGLTWRRIPGFNFKDGHRVIPDPHDPSRIYIATFGSSIWHGPAAGDPAALEDITTPPSMTFGAQRTGKLK